MRASPAFDLESCSIYRCVVGSRAYGLDTDESDTDLRGQAKLAFNYWVQALPASTAMP